MESYNHTSYGARIHSDSGSSSVRGKCTWFDVVADGKNPPSDRHTPTSLEFLKEEYSAYTGYVQYELCQFGEWIGTGPSVSGHIMDSPNAAPSYHLQTGQCRKFSGVDRNKVYNDCLQSLYTKVLQQSNLNISVDIAESREILRLHSGFKDALSGVVSFARKARRKALVEGGKDMVRGISSAWLSYQYGWRPLLSTIHGLVHHARTKYGESVVRARRSEEGTWSATVDDGSYNKCDMTGKSSVRYDMKVFYTVGNDSSLSRQRLASLDPLRLSWELLPYSFVVDWFVDISGYLASLEIRRTSGLDFHNGYVTETYLDQVNGSWTTPEPQFNTYFGERISSINVKGHSEIKGLKRQVLSDFPYPRMPHVHLDLGSGQLLNGSALLARILL